jgi:tyrosine-protein phosphatase YwqE
MKLWGSKKEEFDYGLIGADMHSHILPGVDDGSPDLETSIKLIKGLTGLGFKKLITTPHILWDMYKNTKDDLLQRYGVFKKQLSDEGITTEIRIAAEYFLDDNVKRLLASKEPLLTIYENLVLVEFSMASEPIDFKELLFEMQMQGYQPVIAHPERYVYQERNKEFFEELKIAGYYFQLNIMSLAGTYGKTVNELARYFVKKGYYELAGTDLHNQHQLSHLQHSSITPVLKGMIDSGKLMNPQL